VIKFIVIILVLAAAAYCLKRYQEAKRREAAERQADAWIKFYDGYTGGSWGSWGTGSRTPTMPKSEIGVIHRADPAGTNDAITEQTGTRNPGGGYSVTKYHKVY